MFQKIITKYGLAFHLAVLAALPSALAPFVSDQALGRTVLWLSAIGVLWLFIEPSIRKGERLSQARYRVWIGFMKDPVLWFFMLYAVLCFVRWLNSGVELVYDAEKVAWSVAEPVLSVFPASVKDAGFLPFAVVVAAMTVVLGLRHAVGMAARISFGVCGSLIAGLGGWAAAASACLGYEPFIADAASGFGIVREPLSGCLWGIWFLVALSSGAQAELRSWRRGRLAYTIAIGGNVAGLVFFSPPFVSAAYLGLGLLFAVYVWVWLSRAGSKGTVARNFVFCLLGVGMAAWLLMTFAPASVKDAKLGGLDPEKVWSPSDRDASSALSGIARRMWLDDPWCGAGLGAYPLKASFVARDEDWEVVPPKPVRAVNGYWTLLSERGNVMCGIFALLLGLLFWIWGTRCVEAFMYHREDADADVFPFSCAPVVWLPVIFIPLLAVEGVFASVFSVRTLLLAVMAATALATATFPRRPAGDKQKENN